MDNIEKIKKNLQKILALAENNPNEHEKENARNFAEKLMKKYGITFEDVQEEPRTVREFRYKNEWENSLLTQVCCTFLNIKEVSMKRSSEILFVDLTEKEYKEISHLYETHKENFKKEIEKLLFAYFSKNKLFPECGDTVSKDDSKYSTEDIYFIYSMINHLQATSTNLALENISKNLLEKS